MYVHSISVVEFCSKVKNIGKKAKKNGHTSNNSVLNYRFLCFIW